MTSTWTVPDGVQLVEASAGTGKTHRITDMCVLLVAERGFPIERILVVTFTRSATAELKDRIRGRLRGALAALRGGEASDSFLQALPTRRDAADDGALWEGRLRQALLDFDAAPITTIHGFCHRALNQHALDSGVEPGLSFTGDAKALVERVARDYWIEQTWDLDRSAYVWLTEKAGAYKVTLYHLEQLGLEVLNAPRAEVRPPLGPVVRPDHSLIRSARDAWAAGKNDFLDLIEALRLKLTAPYSNAEKLSNSIRILENWLGAGCTSAPKGNSLIATRAYVLSKVSKRKLGEVTAADLDLDVFDAFDALVDGYDDLQAANRAWAQALVRHFVDVLPERLEEHRRRTATLGYGDLLTELLEALERSGVGDLLAGRVGKQYRAALVDEFQDTDPVQWEVFRRVFGAGDSPLVLVGDEKQAIYQFRGADVFAYRAARKTVPNPARLDRNYRSDRLLVGGVNHLFGRKSPPLVDPFFDREIPFVPVLSKHGGRLHYAGQAARAPLEIRLLQRDDAEDTETWSAPDSQDRVASWTAADVDTMLASSIELAEEDGKRSLRRGDIAVLVRTHSQGQQVQQALRDRGIASVRHSQDDVLRTQEALDLRRLLGAMLQPRRRRLVGAALASDVGGFDSARLHRLQLDEAEWEKGVGNLRGWAGTWRRSGVGAALRAAFHRLETFPNLLRRPEGDRQATNVRHLVELLHEAEVAAKLKPSALLRWLELGIAGVQDPRKAEDDGPDDRQLRLESDSDAVKIVTVHSAKGLQYPVVFCPFLWSSQGSADKRNTRYHVGTDTVLDVTLDKPEDHAGVLQAEVEAVSEALRLAYVAVTRARHRCVIYWGPLYGFNTSTLAWLLHQRPGRADRDAIALWAKGATDGDLLADLRDMRAAVPDAIEVTTASGFPDESGRKLEGDGRDVPYTPFARDGVDATWRLSSFTAMAGDARERPAEPDGSQAEAELDLPDRTLVPQPEDEGIGRDHEDEEEKPRWSQHPEEGSCAPLCRLTPGKRIGNCLHAILEEHDFKAPERLLERCRDQLRAHGFDPDEHGESTARGLQAAIDTVLPNVGIRLADIPMAARLNELEFHLRLRGGEGVRKAQIRGVLAQYRAGTRLPGGYEERFGKANLRPLRGLLKGSIDLVFVHKGRWYLADHKSSWLGHHAEDYDAAAMREPMEHHDYFLQYLIYGVALHRFLEQRLANYRFEEHFGGSFYFFVRGMQSGHGGTTGVFFDPLEGELIPRLADLLSPREDA